MNKYIIRAVLAMLAAAMCAFSSPTINHRELVSQGVGLGINEIQFDNQNVLLQGSDPCSGTGGTGQIVGLGNHTITVKLHNGVREIFSITSQTSIKSAAGAVSESDLKTGIGVTLVVGSKIKDGKRVAMAVVICGERSNNK
jgi:hypothetical protein